MDFFLTYGAHWEARLDSVLNSFEAIGCKAFFAKRSYGESIHGIAIILMCRDPYLDFKQRIRFSKKEKELFIDIMLDLDSFKPLNPKEKDKVVAEKLINEIPLIIAKYKFKDFNLEQFTIDFAKCMKKLN